jgi:hypothetical protein
VGAADWTTPSRPQGGGAVQRTCSRRSETLQRTLGGTIRSYYRAAQDDGSGLRFNRTTTSLRIAEYHGRERRVRPMGR